MKEIQGALRNGRIDLAVHSLKDMPTEPVVGLILAATPLRDDPREALVGATLADLKPGAKVGTSSPRRAAQMRRLLPGVEVVPLRGNVPTRMQKLADGEFDAIILAAAGLIRLDLSADQLLDPNDILPAPGQGALAVEVREGDGELAEMVATIHDTPTRNAVAAERRVLRELGGGCLLPLAAWGRGEGNRLLLDAAVTSQDGRVQVREHGEGPQEQFFGIAKKVARGLIRRGAREILEGMTGS